MITSNYHVCACCRLLCVWGWWSSRIHCHGTWLDHPIKNTIYWWVGYFPMCFHQFNNFWRVHAGICLDSLCAQPVAALLSLESDTTSSCNSVIVMVGVMDTAWQGHVWPLFGLENHGKPWKKRYKAKPLFLFGGDIVAGFFLAEFPMFKCSYSNTIMFREVSVRTKFCNDVYKSSYPTDFWLLNPAKCSHFQTHQTYPMIDWQYTSTSH